MRCVSISYNYSDFKSNGAVHNFLDMETEGLCAPKDAAVSIALKVEDKPAYTFTRDRNMTERELLTVFFAHVREQRAKNNNNVRFITYNGENFQGGFDFPFLRTRTIINGMWEQWPFSNLLCFDLFEHMKRFNTQYEDNTINADKLDTNFTAEQVMTLCEKYKLPATKGKKKENCAALADYHEKLLKKKKPGVPFQQLGYKSKIEPGRKLDHIYTAFGGAPLRKEIASISGGDVPVMWKAYLDGKEENRDIIIEYNKSDVEQLEFVWKRAYSMLPKKAKQMGWTDL